MSETQRTYVGKADREEIKRRADILKHLEALEEFSTLLELRFHASNGEGQLHVLPMKPINGRHLPNQQALGDLRVAILRAVMDYLDALRRALAVPAVPAVQTPVALAPPIADHGDLPF